MRAGAGGWGRHWPVDRGGERDAADWSTDAADWSTDAADWSTGAAAEARPGDGGGGPAASGVKLPAQRRTSSRPPATTMTRPRKESPGFGLVRAAIPVAVARPGTKLYPGLHRAVNDLLDGNPAAGIPRRTPEQVVARINRRWYGENADTRACADYRGCERCTPSGCTAARRGPGNDGDDPEGCDRIKNRNSWLAGAILAQDCQDPRCEDGRIIGGGECHACRARAEEWREAARGAAVARARPRPPSLSLGPPSPPLGAPPLRCDLPRPRSEQGRRVAARSGVRAGGRGRGPRGARRGARSR
ncbi:hypothetical protein [Streptomyces tsukubensis]|uniref:hypothetical protein n=1 Tax=Streptomyces tsukubensis TaxID=83656 RepID=UPI00117DA644|nr:hypothetical protein [Streptomyces tsukubensis]QFR94000.1 hypothetical protein GBW32_14180 [Streptomyces tsukubensis]